MYTLSEAMRHFPTQEFPITGDLDRDIKNYMEYRKIPPYYQHLDDNIYVISRLRLSFGRTLTVHTLTDGVIEKVKHTRIENVPNEIPKFMRQPFLIEARHDKTLFGDIEGIGGFTINDEICLVIGKQSERCYIQHEKASFDGRKIEDINLLYDKRVHYDWYGQFGQNFIQQKTGKDTFAFVTILSLLLEAEKTPLVIDTKRDKRNRKAHNAKKNSTESDWITKRIYIDRDIKYKHASNGHAVLDKNGKVLKDVPVTGYVRMQHYGKDNSETKWIYIEGYDSKRWTSDKDKKIVVDIYDKK
ncbi:MAG: hypothetical protein MdMp014T_1856 [Treponematales bacterium]